MTSKEMSLITTSLKSVSYFTKKMDSPYNKLRAIQPDYFIHRPTSQQTATQNVPHRRPIHLSFLRKDRATSSCHPQWKNESRMRGISKGLESLGLQAEWRGPGMVPEEPHGL